MKRGPMVFDAEDEVALFQQSMDPRHPAMHEGTRRECDTYDLDEM